jgi:protein O-GlcNAc transferase
VYQTGTMFDAFTRQAQTAADRWTEASRLTDAQLHAQIVRDEVDILVDLGGHTANHRLGVFAMGSAPVQATYLGYPHSTGLSCLDWLIGDATVAPAEQAHLFSEGIAQLPGSVFCWAPVEDYALPSARPADAPPVFGSFNNSIKIGPRTVALWSRVLHAVPGSRLLLKAPSLDNASVRDGFVAQFKERGIGAKRLILRGPSGLKSMMQEYGDMDIALDTTPYNGGTTSMQALWMGVPVVTLQGGNFVRRMGASFMRTLGRAEWVARDEDGYVAIARRLAVDCPSVRTGRAELRRQMQASPLCDVQAHTRQLEALYEKMWELRCTGNASRLIHPGLAAQA